MLKKLSIKTIVAIGIGAAVFIILGRFGSIPTFVPNVTIETSYPFLALMSLLFGPVAGLLIGLIGHTIKDSIMYGSPWFSWVIASGIFGLLVGLAAKKLNIQEGKVGVKKIVAFNIVQVVANAITWFLVAPTLDILIYAEPANKVYLQGITAGIADIITVGVITSILLVAYGKTITQKGSLTKEQ
ncbi:ECF-type riboflavin transporter substrate-binding protein [Clostridium sp. 19966]|uniref:ECF-type riboflavin transporter substrate-binding protein n=1 Tax=Clostridium sp. 19966 TaxID=2768166 RepID=UPI0037BEA29F